MCIRILTLLLSVVITSASYAQHYSIHSATKGVTIESAGRTVTATEGMSLNATDCLNIPENGKAEVFNSLDKRIYSSIRPGKISVTKLIIEARQSATDKLAGIGDKIKLGRSQTPSGKRVYVEKGMVRRTLGVAGDGDALPDSLDSTPGCPHTGIQSDTIPHKSESLNE
ncbi:MAG: hypothetical protein K2L59_00970 [Muribaculaceae bacterium]|nr:hypothetical protein [Muribaculaceae bacterium]